MLDEFRAVIEAAEGGLLLESEPLPEPQWEFDFDKEALEDKAEELRMESEAWFEEMEHIERDWQDDTELLNHYYLTYKMEPHLKKGAKLDEKALRTIITFIADSTTVKGRPLNEVFPDIEEMMMSNYNADEPSLWEKMGLFNLQGAEYQEWYAASWPKYENCVGGADFTVEAA